jgi:hypothetical protein
LVIKSRVRSTNYSVLLMKTYIADIIPRLKNFSNKLDNLTLLTNQHWVLIDDINNHKIVYIFRANNELLISQNGRVEKAKWEYLGNNSLLIDRKEDSYLFKHGFFDQNILALKVDSKEEYAFLVNENNYDGELNSLFKVIDFLTKKYIEPQKSSRIEGGLVLMKYQTNKGTLEIEQNHDAYPDLRKGRNAFMNGQLAPNGKYKLGFMWYVTIENGQIN